MGARDKAMNTIGKKKKSCPHGIYNLLKEKQAINNIRKQVIGILGEKLYGEKVGKRE